MRGGRTGAGFPCAGGSWACAPGIRAAYVQGIWIMVVRVALGAWWAVYPRLVLSSGDRGARLRGCRRIRWCGNTRLLLLRPIRHEQVAWRITPSAEVFADCRTAGGLLWRVR